MRTTTRRDSRPRFTRRIRSQIYRLAAGARGPSLRPLRPRLPQQPQRQTTWRATDELLSPRAGLVVKPLQSRLGLRQLQRVVPAQLRRPVLLADRDDADARARAVHELRDRRQVGCAPRPLDHRGGLPAGPHEYIGTGPARSDADGPNREASARAGWKPASSGDITRNWHLIGGFTRQNAEIISDDAAAAGWSASCRSFPNHVLALEPLRRAPGHGRRPRRGPPVGHVRCDRQHGRAAGLHASGRAVFVRVSPNLQRAAQRRKHRSTRTTSLLRTATTTSCRALVVSSAFRWSRAARISPPAARRNTPQKSVSLLRCFFVRSEGADVGHLQYAGGVSCARYGQHRAAHLLGAAHHVRPEQLDQRNQGASTA